MKKSTKKGFTLVELVIVIAVIAILAAVLIPTFSNVVARANASADLQTLTTTLEGKFVEYVADAHKAPTGIIVKETDSATTFVDFVAADYDLTNGEYKSAEGYAVYSKVFLTGKNGYAFVVALTGDGSYSVAHVTSAGSQPEPMLYKDFVKDARFVEEGAVTDAIIATVKGEDTNAWAVTKLTSQNYYENNDVVAAEYTKTVSEPASVTTYVNGTFTVKVAVDANNTATVTADVKTAAVAG